MTSPARPIWLDPRSLAFRLIALSAALSASALVVTFILLTQLFEQHLKRALDTELALHVEELAAAIREGGPGAITVDFEREPDQFRHELSGHYWQVSDGDAVVARSRSLWDARLPDPAPDRAVGRIYFSEIVGPRGEALRIAERALEFTLSGKTLTFAVAEDMAPISQSIGQFNRSLAVTLIALGLCLVAATLFLLKYGLRPLARIGEELARIRSGQGRYLTGRLPSEIQPLAIELNALVDHHESIIQRARAQAGDLAHALKTPLAVLRNELENTDSMDRSLALTQLQAMSDVTQRHLARAQAAGSRAILGARSPVRPVVEALARTLPKMADHAIAIDCDFGSTPTFFAGEEQDLQELLGIIMDNACKWAKSRVRVSVALTGQRLNIAIGDDGPGIPPDKRSVALSRGARLDEEVEGSGLGLAIALDLVQLYQGTMTLGNSSLGGLLVEINLPAA